LWRESSRKTSGASRRGIAKLYLKISLLEIESIKIDRARKRQNPPAVIAGRLSPTRSGMTGRPSIPEAAVFNRKAAAYLQSPGFHPDYPLAA
jgi:hypothetical protein